MKWIVILMCSLWLGSAAAQDTKPAKKGCATEQKAGKKGCTPECKKKCTHEEKKVKPLKKGGKKLKKDTLTKFGV